jgi:hypothetical protein
MAKMNVIPDGNEEIATELPMIVALIARTARWVHPKTFLELPVWCPWAARGRPLYDKTWQRRTKNTRRDDGSTREKVEANVDAANALVAALGVASPKPRCWTVCHIWGYDDEAFKSQSKIVQNPRYYSCVGNMIWLPTPLKGFTDALPEVKDILRTCAYYLYDWACEDESVEDQVETIRAGLIPPNYPESWPCPDRPDLIPPKTAPFTAGVVDTILMRRARIRSMLADHSLTHFPRDEVRQVLDFWNIDI